MKTRHGFMMRRAYYGYVILWICVAMAITHIADASVLEWDSNPIADGYKIYYSTDSTVEIPDPAVDVGDVTQYELCSLPLEPCIAYWIRVAAYNASGEIFVTNATLYPNNVPQITVSPNVVGIVHDEATIQWATDVASTSVVHYGTTAVYGNTASSSLHVLNHNINLTGLAPNTTYHFRATSLDSNNCGPGCITATNSPPGDQVFTTQPAPDLTPPVITVEPIVSLVTETTATIEWTTDEDSSTAVYFDSDASGEPYGFFEGNSTVFVTSHSWTLNGLSPGTLYFCKVSSTDAAGNGPTFSDEITFTTQSLQTDVPAPPGGLRVID